MIPETDARTAAYGVGGLSPSEVREHAGGLVQRILPLLKSASEWKGCEPERDELLQALNDVSYALLANNTPEHWIKEARRHVESVERRFRQPQPAGKGTAS